MHRAVARFRRTGVIEPGEVGRIARFIAERAADHD